MSKALSLLFCLLTLFSVQTALASSLKLSSKAKGQIVGVRITDVAKYLSGEVSKLNLSKLNNFMLNNADKIFSEDSDVETVHNIFFTELPRVSGKHAILNLIAFVEYEGDVFNFEKMEISYPVANVGLASFRLKKIISLSNTKFSIQTALAPRKVIFTEKNNGFKMVFPLGVGSFDEGILNDGVSLLTPRFKNAYVDKRAAIKNRKYPRYYAGKPFIRIIRSKELNQETRTNIGFHIQPWEKPFIRAFDSHGCIRMQEADLLTFYNLLAHGPSVSLPITVSYYVNDKSEHPMSVKDIPYKTVRNVGKNGKKDYRIDFDKLVEVKKLTDRKAPVAKLKDRSNDDYHNLFDYDIQKREAAKKSEHEKMCREKHLSEEGFPEFDESRFVLRRSDYKVYRYSYDTDSGYYKAKEEAEERYQRDLKSMKSRRANALEDFQDQVEDLRKEKKEEFEKCIESKKRRCTAAERFRYLRTHGSAHCD